MFTDQVTALLILLALGCFTGVLKDVFNRGPESGVAASRPRPATAKADRDAVGRARCIHCGSLLEIELPPPSNVDTCRNCGRRFAIVLWDADNNLYVSALEAGYGLEAGGSWTVDRAAGDAAHWLAVLGLDGVGNLERISLRQIRKAYYRNVRRYHPDKYHHLPAEFRLVAEHKTRRLHEAYRELLRLKLAAEPRADSAPRSRALSLSETDPSCFHGLKQ